MTDFLTTLPWGWYALALALIAGFIWLVYWYDEQPATPDDHYLTAIHDNIRAGRCTLVAARLEAVSHVVDELARDEADQQWAGVEREWLAYVRGLPQTRQETTP